MGVARKPLYETFWYYFALAGLGQDAPAKFGLDPGISQRLRRSGCGRETLHLVACRLRALTHHGQRRRLACARDSIQTDDFLAPEKNLIDRLSLPCVQLRVPVFGFRYEYLTAPASGRRSGPKKKNGSSGRTRTYNPPVNSRMLCH